MEYTQYYGKLSDLQLFFVVTSHTSDTKLCYAKEAHGSASDFVCLTSCSFINCIFFSGRKRREVTLAFEFIFSIILHNQVFNYFTSRLYAGHARCERRIITRFETFCFKNIQIIFWTLAWFTVLLVVLL